ncbi:MAG: DUF2975 domain-containing protein [Oscillospiraceae bacterium]
MKYLNKIQKIYSVAFVLLKILISISVIAAVLSLAGVVWIMIGSNTSLGDNFILMFIWNTQKLSNNQIICELLIAFVKSISYLFMFRTAIVYVKNEIAIGTPFDKKVAKQLTRVGLTMIITTCACSLVTAIIYGVSNGFSSATLHEGNGQIATIIIGAILLVLSLIFSYGVEISETQQQ